MSMRIGVGLATVTAGRRLSELGGELGDYEKAGVEVIFVPELYGLDAVSRLGYLAARTAWSSGCGPSSTNCDGARVPARAGVAEGGGAPPAQVCPGGEVLPRPGDHDDPHPVVGLKPGERFVQLAGHVGGEGVAVLRPVRPDRRDLAGYVGEDGLIVAHVGYP